MSHNYTRVLVYPLDEEQQPIRITGIPVVMGFVAKEMRVTTLDGSARTTPVFFIDHVCGPIPLFRHTLDDAKGLYIEADRAKRGRQQFILSGDFEISIAVNVVTCEFGSGIGVVDRLIGSCRSHICTDLPPGWAPSLQGPPTVTLPQDRGRQRRLIRIRSEHTSD